MKILLHMCCGPCSCYPVKHLRALGHEPVGYFFNPNIHPYKEFMHRLETTKEYAAKAGLELVADDEYQLREFVSRALAAETDAEKGRCRMCYSWRLQQAAIFARENGFEAFTSSLFVSPYQQHEVMKKTAEAIAQSEGVPFFYQDFREGWQEGVAISLEMELYRQPYCGCIFSEEERYSKAWKKKQKQAAKERRQQQLAETVE